MIQLILESFLWNMGEELAKGLSRNFPSLFDYFNRDEVVE